MPKRDGINLVEALKGQLECIIIFMSAYTDKDYLKSAIRFHAAGYVEKPIVLSELRRTIEEAISLIRGNKRSGPPVIPEEAAAGMYEALQNGQSGRTIDEDEAAYLKRLGPLSDTALLTAKITFVLEHFYRDPNLYIPFICKQVSASRSTVCGAFKKETGKTVNEAITEFRMEKACDLLQNSGRPIALVAADTGFADQNYFARTFKRMFGVTPSEYRARLTK
jgi:YesN/AraC family two-component response regulator